MLYLRGDVFLRVALVRVKAEVAGYLNDNMGIVEYKDDKGVKVNILFHADDVKVFKKDLREYGKSAKRTLPVGCLVSVDARRVHVAGVKNVEYQAVVVLAGFSRSFKARHHDTIGARPQGICQAIMNLCECQTSWKR